MIEEQLILERVEENRQKIIEFIQKIVQIPSVTLDEVKVGQAIYEGMLDLGLDDVQIVEAEPGHPNVLGKVIGKADGPTLTFNGHIDVVPPGPEKEWTNPPFSGKIVDGKLYGRGSVDMKSGTCCSILAAGIIKQLGIPLAGNVLLTAVCDEEICGDRGIVHLIKEGYVKKNHDMDMGLNCEPTNLKTIDIAHKGVLRAHIIVHGKNAAGSRPWLGINAIEHANRVLNRINILAEQIKIKKHPLLTYPTILVATIEGGRALNVVPDTCTIGICRRLLPSESKEAAIHDFEVILDQLAKEDPSFQAELKVWKEYRPALDVPPEAPIIQAVQRAHRLVRGEDLPISSKDAGTDAPFVVVGTGIPMPVYGPGDFYKCATIDENIDVEDVIDAVKVYALAIYYALGIENEK